MAGRPVNEAQREDRKREVDTAISFIQKRQHPVTKKAIAEEMGLTIQSFYGPGFLSQYVKELEESGVIVKERGNAAALTATEAKKLMKTISSLHKEINRLKERLSTQEKALAEKDREIVDLIEQLEIERGNTFLEQKREFARHRI